FGYQVNDDEPVFDPYNAVFAETTEDSVKEKGGEYARRYRVVIPLSSGDQSSMRVVAKLVDGTIVKLNGTKKGTNTDFLTNNTDVVPFKSISNVIDYDDSEDIVMNLDRIDWNFSPLVSEGVTTRAYADTFLDPDDVLDAVQYSGSFISYAGWVCFTQPVIGFGYMVGGDIVLKEGFLAYNEEDDPNTGAQGLRSTISSWGVDGSNAQRFYINVPISSYTGTNEVCAVAQLQDGTVVKLNSELHHERSTAFTIKGLEVPQGTAAPATEPATAKPTDEPAPTDAPAPTEAPKVTDAPAPTGGKTYTDKTSAPDEKDVKKNNTGLVIGIVCGAVILAAAVAGIIVASKKKKK
ncbi:MAG: hypothetical protein J5950_09975, partial [Clostridia bacterium]|nr:hypothetical protein [Clostridia bacterium]